MQWARCLYRQRFPNARLNVRVGGWAPASCSYRQLANTDPAGLRLPTILSQDPAAIIFTSGSTGPAKGADGKYFVYLEPSGGSANVLQLVAQRRRHRVGGGALRRPRGRRR